MSGLPVDNEQSVGRRAFFPRTHRLKRRSLIRPLFDRTHPDVRSSTCGAVRALFRLCRTSDFPEGVHHQATFTVSRAAGAGVARNRMRRQMREAYRLNHRQLADELERQDVALTVVFIARRDTTTLASDVRRLLTRIERGLSHWKHAAESYTVKHEKRSGS